METFANLFRSTLAHQKQNQQHPCLQTVELAGFQIASFVKIAGRAFVIAIGDHKRLPLADARTDNNRQLVAVFFMQRVQLFKNGLCNVASACAANNDTGVAVFFNMIEDLGIHAEIADLEQDVLDTGFDIDPRHLPADRTGAASAHKGPSESTRSG